MLDVYSLLGNDIHPATLLLPAILKRISNKLHTPFLP
jgi:hypothetical protein